MYNSYEFPNMNMRNCESFLLEFSEKTPSDPWNIPQTLNYLFISGNPFIFVFWGTWGLFDILFMYNS